MAALLEKLHRMQRGEEPLPPVCDLLGMTLQTLEVGRAVFRMNIEPRHHNFLGAVHGGVYCDLSDVAMGFAFATLLAEGERYTTVELKINYLKPFRAGLLVAEAKIVQAGRTLGLVECDIRDGTDLNRLIARAGSTCMRIQERQTNVG